MAYNHSSRSNTSLNPHHSNNDRHNQNTGHRHLRSPFTSHRALDDSTATLRYQKDPPEYRAPRSCSVSDSETLLTPKSTHAKRKKRYIRSYDRHDDQDRDDISSLDFELQQLQTSAQKRRKTRDDNTWQCSLCTLDNRKTDAACQACQAPNPHLSRSSQSRVIAGREPPQMHEVKQQEESSNMSTLINGLQNFQLSAKAHANAKVSLSGKTEKEKETESEKESKAEEADESGTLDCMQGLIQQLQTFQFDRDANSALNSSARMNGLMHTLSALHVSHSGTDKHTLDAMVSDMNGTIHKFIIELQQSLYWRYKLRNEERKFRKLGAHRQNIDRLIQSLTFYHDHCDDEAGDALSRFVHDPESNFRFLEMDYRRVIEQNVVSMDRCAVRMRCMFALLSDYVSQNIPACEADACAIYKRYRADLAEEEEEDEDDDVLDGDEACLMFRKRMNVVHCYLFHARLCGVLVEGDRDMNGVNGVSVCAQPQLQTPQKLKEGGRWHWLYDDDHVKWVPYDQEQQMQLNYSWNHGVRESLLDGKWKVLFQFTPSHASPSGFQQAISRAQDGWGECRRAIVYGFADNDGMLNGIVCEKQPVSL